MSIESDRRSPLFRFCDAFFQEQNIKWMLAVGMLILLGSSLMLVTTHWESYAPVWKYLVLLGYTLAIHVAGQGSFHWLGLRKTGTGLMALTVLLIPLSFLAVRWVHPVEALTLTALLQQSGLLVLLAANGVASTLAARRIFRHFLRREQPTFLVSYLLLSAAGVVIPFLYGTAAVVGALLLWLLYAAGSVKVNRHVFWLTEEHRLPRICGFFPILLLGGQFLTLFALSLAPQLTWGWIGFEIVLTAVPLLLAADALLGVHRARHGDGPFPDGLVLPLFAGLCGVVAGVIVSGIGYPESTSLVPTAAAAAVVLGVAARRTGRSLIVWLALAALVATYQTSPVFFRELVRAIVQGGAAAVREDRLPYAFYGLTYLPLLVVTSLAAAWRGRRHDELFAAPLRQFSIGLGLLLWGAALTHTKALLPVGLSLSALFVVQAMLFRVRRLSLASGIGWMTAAVGFSPFAAGVLGWSATPEWPLLAWVIGGGALHLIGPQLDRAMERWPADRLLVRTGPLQGMSRGVAIAGMVGWCIHFSASAAPAILSSVLIALLLLREAVRRESRVLGQVALGYILLATVGTMARLQVPFGTVIGVGVGLLAIYWYGGQWLGRSSGANARTFAAGAEQLSRIGLTAAGMLLVGASCGSLVTGVEFRLWGAGVIAVLGCMDIARRRLSGARAAIAWLGLLGLCGVATLEILGRDAGIPWLVAVWGSVAVLAIPIVRRVEAVLLRHTATLPPQSELVRSMLRACLFATLTTVALASLLFFETPYRVAGAVACGGLLLLAGWWQALTIRRLAVIVVNWQLLGALVQVCCPDVSNLSEVTLQRFAAAALPIACGASLSALAWQVHRRREPAQVDAVLMHAAAMRAVAWLSLGASFHMSGTGLSILHAVLAVMTFALMAIEQIGIALSAAADTPRQSAPGPGLEPAELRVWLGEVIIAAAVGYLAWFGVIRLGDGKSMFLLLACGVSLLAAAAYCRRRDPWRVLACPFETTGLLLPAATVAIGIGRHLLREPVWLGANSLAMLLAAGFYFWNGLERQRKSFVLAAALFANLAFAFLWSELSWTDPQFFLIPIGATVLGLVELLKRDIAGRLHNPLRYAGAIVILVSPTFHIVDGSWTHLISLMVISVLVTWLGIGSRIRALMYLGTGFLVADLLAMVVRGSIDRPSLLWFAGIAVGAAVIALAAYCERHREDLLQRMRFMAAELETWK